MECAAQLDNSTSDWVLRGIPGGCVIESVEDQPLSELLKVGPQIVGSGPHLTLATTEPILVQTREEPLLEALVLPLFPCPVRF